eukprot:3394392-Amphidinium_carterae.1
MYVSIWVGGNSIGAMSIPKISVDSNNPRKSAASTQRSQYTIAAWPNAGKLVRVNMNPAIRIYDMTSAEIDWMQVSFGLRAVTMIDIWLGGDNMTTRNFTPTPSGIATPLVHGSDAKTASVVSLSTANGVIPLGQRSEFIAALANCQVMITVERGSKVDDQDWLQGAYDSAVEKVKQLSALQIYRNLDIRYGFMIS